MSQGQLSDLYAAYPGNPQGVSTSIFNCKKGTLVIDTANATVYQKQSQINDNGSYTEIGSGAGPQIVVSASGSDTGSGTAASPFATGDAALAALGGSGTIVFKTGTYDRTAAINLDNAVEGSSIRIVRESPQAIVNVVMGDSFGGATGWTSEGSSTYSKAIEAHRWTAYYNTHAPLDGSAYCFELATPERAISTHHAFDEGRSYALPHTRLVNRATTVITSETWTRSTATITVNSTAHGRATGNILTITATDSAAATGAVGVDVTITVVNADQFTFTGIAAGAASGTTGLSLRVSDTTIATDAFAFGWTHVANSIAAVKSGANGGFFFDQTTNRIYIKATDGSNPASNGKSYIMPGEDFASDEDVGSMCFTYGGSGTNVSLEVEGINVYFATRAFSARKIASAVFRDCLAFGCAEQGWYFREVPRVERYRCEAAAGYTYGYQPILDAFGADTPVRMAATDYDCWSHDNGGQGVVASGGVDYVSYGGLGEYLLDGWANNADNGAPVAEQPSMRLYNPHTRNCVRSGIQKGVGFVEIYDHVSESDPYAEGMVGSGAMTSYSPEVISPTSAPFSVGSTLTMTVANPKVSGNPAADMFGGAGTGVLKDATSTQPFLAVYDNSISISGHTTLSSGWTDSTPNGYDPSGVFNTANGRWTPGRIGMCEINVNFGFGATANRVILYISKNGTEVFRITEQLTVATSQDNVIQGRLRFYNESAANYYQLVYFASGNQAPSTTDLGVLYMWGNFVNP